MSDSGLVKLVVDKKEMAEKVAALERQLENYFLRISQLEDKSPFVGGPYGDPFAYVVSGMRAGAEGFNAENIDLLGKMLVRLAEILKSNIDLEKNLRQAKAVLDIANRDSVLFSDLVDLSTYVDQIDLQFPKLQAE